jgi:hypothetical protein
MRMTRMAGLVIALLGLVFAVPAGAHDGIKRKTVELKGGVADVSGSISGDESIDYEFRSPGAQVVGISLKTSHKMAYFNLLPADSEDAIFIGSVSGTKFLGELPAAGTYRIRVYLMRAAARRNETATYTLSVSLRPSNKPAPADAPAASAATEAGNGAPGAAAPVANSKAHVQARFDQTLALQGITFRVQSPNAGLPNKLLITPSGLTVDNASIARPVEGLVVAAEVADLNADGSPEVYVFVQAPGGDARSSLVAYAANRRRSLSDIYLPPIDETPGNAQGYRGHDEMRTVEDTLARRFPVYKEGDAADTPSGGTRQLQYKLVAGEADWRLKLDRVVAY